MMSTQTIPKLAPPGAGLPFLENLYARYWAFPQFSKKTPWDGATRFFEEENQKILKMISPLNEAQKEVRVLIDRVPGLEDSSRYWSVAMTLEHLVIVGSVFSIVIRDLSAARTPQLTIGIKDVKPPGKYLGHDCVDLFQRFTADFLSQMAIGVEDRNSKLTARHPWLGPLNAHDWHGLAAIHTRIHRQQIAKIIKGLPS